MWTRLVALVVVVLTLSFVAPAHAADASAPKISTGYDLTPLKLAQRDVRLSSAGLATGIVLTVSGPLVFLGGVAIVVGNCVSGATCGPGTAAGMLGYGLVATPVGVLLTVISGVGLGTAKHRVRLLEAEFATPRGDKVRVAVTPARVGKSPGLTIAATW